MAVKDTHKAFERLTDAGYSKEMAEALLETLGDSWDELVTKPYLDTRLNDLEGRMREQELRIRLHLYAVAIVVIGVLAALELIPR